LRIAGSWSASVDAQVSSLAQQVHAMLGRGDSAIVCLLRQPDPELAARFAKLGGTVHTIALTPEQAAKVDARLPV